MEWLLGYGLVFGRLASFWAMLPLLGGSDTLPPYAKAVLLICFMPFMVNPNILMGANLHADIGYVLLLSKEICLGLFIGFVVGLPLRIPQMIGDFIDAQRGAAVTDQYNPLAGEETGALGQILSFTVMAYFLSENGLDYLLRIVSGSFVLQSPLSFGFGVGGELSSVYLTIFGDYMRLFAILSMPAVIAMLMTDVALGLASRAATSINAFQLSQPVKAIIAIMILIMVEPRIVSGLISWMRALGEQFGA